MDAHYLACDLGAESGRLMLATLADGRLTLEEVHRFPNAVIQTDEGSLHWDIPALFAEVKVGLKKAAALGVEISGFSVDSWGVDYTLFDAEDRLMSPTFCYRDPRTERGVKNAYEKTDWETIFAETGIQYMPLNTLFQLMAESPERLAEAKLLLGVGDGFHFMLSGRRVIEESMASTFQLYNPTTRDWSDKLIGTLGLPRAIFPAIVPSGEKLGPMLPEIVEESGLGGVEVVATCSHDTGTAVAAVPATEEGSWAYISSGTWSLIGVETEEPILTDACREMNFTNEIGYGGTVRLLKNIIGLWLVQECRREWERRGEIYDYAELTRLAEEAEPLTSLIDPSDPRFVAPGDMPGRIAKFCQETDQAAPEGPGATIRCALESLALLYGKTLRQVEEVTEVSVDRLHIVGGGSKNQLLNQLTANAVGIPVIAGPGEATAAGNALIQAITLGQLDALADARRVVRNSFELKTFEARDTGAWSAAGKRFEAILK
ncbi:MAG: rhamnulokinase [Limisphaerales bacterium]|jgi:rhamnulokinase